MHAGQPSRRGRAIVSTGTAHGSHRSGSLHVHWPIPVGSLTTAWSGRIIRPGGPSSAGRLWGRLQRSYDAQRSQRTRQGRNVLPTGRPVETPREFLISLPHWKCPRAPQHIVPFSSIGRDRVPQPGCPVAHQGPMARGWRQLPIGPSFGARRPHHADQPQSTSPATGRQKQESTVHQFQYQQQFQSGVGIDTRTTYYDRILIILSTRLLTIARLFRHQKRKNKNPSPTVP